MNKTQQNSFSEIGSVIAGVVLATFFLFMAPYVFAQQPLVNIAPYNATSEGCVVITSVSWTQAPATTYVGRLGFYWTNPTTSPLYGVTDNTVGISSPAYILPAKSSYFVGLSDAKTFYQRADSGASSLLGCAAQERN